MSGTVNQPIRPFVVFGTRPEAVKLLEPIRTLRADARFAPRIVVTGQHREMLDEILVPFGITPDANLGIMRPGQTLNEIVYRSMPKLDELYAEGQPDIVLVQGDTTSAFCAALAAFHRRIPVAHVEAGLRSFNRFHPYPEESNRRMITSVADLHFAPTARAAENVVREGAPESDVIVTGNTVVDSLLLTLRDTRPPESIDAPIGDRRGPLVLITLHRRESFETKATGAGNTEPAGARAAARASVPPSAVPSATGPETAAAAHFTASEPCANPRAVPADAAPVDAAPGTLLEGILQGIRRAAEDHPEAIFVYPVHLNPKVREPVQRILGGVPNILLSAPMAYVPFVHLMARAALILTDSGGIQEEAPSLGVPVLVLRETTERPEGLAAGTNRLVGTSPARIREEIARCLAADRTRPLKVPCPNPFGDGRAHERIRDAILHFFGAGARPAEFRFDAGSAAFPA